MTTTKPLLWFEKRRKSKTMSLVQQQMTLTLGIAKKLDTSMKAYSEKKQTDMDDAIQRLFVQEEEIDRLRRVTFEELPSSELPDSYRENLKRLVSHINELADQVKDSARGLMTLARARPRIPDEIIGQYLTISQDLVKEVEALGGCLETLSINPFVVKVKAEQVDLYEDKIDDEYLNAKKLFVKYGKELEAGTMMALRDLLDFMERASDTSDRTADYIRTLAASERP
ncbi:DUF47 family protein [Candidatus Bathyarchaeota archaeon]|nr:DUF47 family protein [Candidatus Bathyarchaeota archaeon]